MKFVSVNLLEHNSWGDEARIPRWLNLDLLVHIEYEPEDDDYKLTFVNNDTLWMHAGEFEKIRKELNLEPVPTVQNA